jgi:hypothetical protein
MDTSCIGKPGPRDEGRNLPRKTFYLLKVRLAGTEEVNVGAPLQSSGNTDVALHIRRM